MPPYVLLDRYPPVIVRYPVIIGHQGVAFVPQHVIDVVHWDVGIGDAGQRHRLTHGDDEDSVHIRFCQIVRGDTDAEWCFF